MATKRKQIKLSFTCIEIFHVFACMFSKSSVADLMHVGKVIWFTFIMQDMETFVNRKDVMNLRKKEVLHKKWNERVYKPLRKKIIEAMDSNDWPEVDRRKREMHRQYLEFVNEKVGGYF